MKLILEHHKKAILIIFIASFFYVLPIILVKAYYIDDMTRSLTGQGWDHDGRLLATWIMKRLTIGNQIVDVYPFAQILGSLILSISGYIICVRFGIKGLMTAVISSMIITTSPFMMENLSYRYDSLTMALSILSVCMPFIWYEKKTSFFISSAIGILFSLQIYQASALSYFIILSAFITKDIYLRNYIDTLYKSVISIFSFSFAYFISSKILKFYSIDLAGRNRFIIDSISPLDILKHNIDAATHMVSTLYTPTYSVWLAPLILLSVISIAFISIRCLYLDKAKGIYGFTLTILCFLGVIICIPGVNIFLEEPWWTSRTMIGYAFAILYSSLLLSLFLDNSKIMIVILSMAILPSFIICASYSSALSHQNKFTDEVISLSFPYLSKNPDSELVIDGIGPESRRLKLAMSSFPVIHYLVPKYLNNGWAWGVNYFKLYDMINKDSWIVGKQREKVISEKCSYNVVERNKFFTLRNKGNVFIIDFNNGCN